MSLFDGYAALAVDLDGVVYRGPTAVPYAVAALEAANVPVLFATNNASRPPADVATHLSHLGLSCSAADVVTSSQAGAWLLTERLTPGAAVLAVGGPGVAQSLTEAGFVSVDPAQGPDHEVSAVLQGYGPEVRAADLAEAAYAIQRGAIWVATNTDGTLPTDRGVAPGNGTLIAAVQRAVGGPPSLVAGKPQTPIYDLVARRLGVSPSTVLAIGDRLDTDIEGAVSAGMDSLLVLTGVDDLDAALTAPLGRRPTYVLPDLSWVGSDRWPGPSRGASGAESEGLTAAVRAVWQWRDAHGEQAPELAGLRHHAQETLERMRRG